MKTIAIHQPYYFPWLGFFHKMRNCDIFVFLDDVKQSKKDFVNRCKIKTQGGVKWLTVPLLNKEDRIDKLMIAEGEKDERMLPLWQDEHWRIIEGAYQKAPYWNDYSNVIHEIFYDYHRDICSLDMQIIGLFKGLMDAECGLLCSSDLGITSTGSQRNLDICKVLNADKYLSGTGAIDYNEPIAFGEAGIELVYSDFKHPTYPQLWGDFVERLSVLDYLFNCGEIK